MDHDNKAENWSRGANRYPGCVCEPWRYSPIHTRPTNPDCKTHGNQRT